MSEENKFLPIVPLKGRVIYPYVTATIDRFEEVGEQATEEKYSVPEVPIIIKSVKITRY